MAAQRSQILRLIAAMWRTPKAMIVALMCTVAVTLFDATIPLITGSAVDAVTGAIDRELRPIVFALVAVALGRFLMQFGRRFTAGWLALKLQHALRVEILDTLQQLDGPEQDRLRTGQVVSRSISDLAMLQGLVSMLPLFIGQILKVVITLGIMVWISPPLSILGFVIMPVLVAVTVISRRSLFAATWSAQQGLAELATHVEETVTGVRVVKAFSQQGREIRKLNALSRKIYALMLRQSRLQARFQPLVQQLPAVALVLGIGFGGWLALHGHITIGTFVAFSAYLSALTGVASMVAVMMVQIQLGLAASARVFEVLDLSPTHADPKHPAALPAGSLGLRLNGVHFSNPLQGVALETSTSDNRHHVLRGVDLEVHPGETLALVGPPGAGKTMLVQLLTGFYRPEAGEINLLDFAGKSTSYDELDRAQLRQVIGCVFDEPFLYSASIRENISMGLDVPLDEIVKAAEAAQAHELIERLDNGYEEVIGERGLTLSGGQRQRIAIARALLRFPRILILDDATSAIDATTEAAIYAYLRELGAELTIITIAHRHSTLELADRIALMDSGVIKDVGSYAHMRANPEFRRLMDLKHNPSLESAEHAEAVLQALNADSGPEPAWEKLWPAVPQRDTRLDTNPMQLRRSAMATPMMRKGSKRGGGLAAATPASAKLLARVDKLPPATAAPPTSGEEFLAPLPRVRARDLFRHVGWLILWVIGLYVVNVLAGLAIPTLVRQAIDQGVTPGNESALWRITALGLGAVAIAWVAAIGSTLLTAMCGERLLYELRIRSYAHLQRLGIDYYEKTMSGSILTRMTSDIDSLNTFLQTGLANAVVALATLVGITGLLGFTSLPLSLVALSAIPVAAVATIAFRRYSSHYYAVAREELSAVNAAFHEYVSGLKTSQLHQVEALQLADFSAKAGRYRAARVRTQLGVALYFPSLGAINEFTAAAVLAVGAGMVGGGTMSAGVLVAFLLYLDRLFQPIQDLSQVFDTYQQAQVSFRRITDLLSTPAHPTEQGTTARASEQQRAQRAAAGDLEFHNVTFSYGPDLAPVTKDFSVRLESGTTVAVVGTTGAGKSTMVKLLERFYLPDSGSITASGVDISTIPITAWRRTIGFVPQESHLFSGSVASNIAYGRPEATEEEITDAARRVGALAAIAAIPGGFHAQVGERGRALSSGQRQLVALARAELLEPKIMLLDEATATLDPATEATMLKASEKATAGRTAVIVAHRLATAARADRILVMERGAIVEDGNHEELLTFGGRYATMWGSSSHSFPS